MQAYKEVLGEVLIDEETLQKRVAELGAEISADYEGTQNLLLICILRGGVPFMVDLSRHIRVPHMMDFMAVSSYGAGLRESTGNVRVIFDLQMNIKGKDVLLVEDIVVEIDQGIVGAGGYFITGEFGRFRAWLRGVRRRDCLSGSDQIFRGGLNRRSCLHRIAEQ